MNTSTETTNTPATLDEWLFNLNGFVPRAGWGRWDSVSASIIEGVQVWSTRTGRHGYAVGVWGMVVDANGDRLEDGPEYSIYFGDCMDPAKTGFSDPHEAMSAAESLFPAHFSDPAETAGYEGVSCKRYELRNGRSLFVDYADGEETETTSSETLIGHLRDWEWASMGFERFSLFLAAMGLDGLQAENTTPDADAECLVWCQPNYYGGTSNAPTAGFVMELDSQGYPTDRIRVFPNATAAAAYISAYYSEPSGYDGIPQRNVLAHGQAGPDTLTIVEA